MGKILIIKDTDFSNVAVGSVTLSADGPTITIDESGVVTISTDVVSTIYYTIDGSTPTTSSTLYEQQFSVTNNTVVKAIAVVRGVISPVSIETFTIELTTLYDTTADADIKELYVSGGNM